jgi:hypothetical protein
MPADERLRVIFKHVHVKSDADCFGSGEWYFRASVDGTPVGDPSFTFNAVEDQHIRLPAANWTCTVNVRDRRDIVVQFQAFDRDVAFDDNLRTVRHVLRSPYRQFQYRHRHETRYYVLDWDVELSVLGRFGRHAPNTVFATRSHAGSVTATTVSGGATVARMEISPVRPTPPDAALPRRPTVVGAAAAVPPERNGAFTDVTAGVPPVILIPDNIIPNPAVIPILSPPASASAPPLPAGSPPRADSDNAARIEFSYYRPNTLAFTDDDPRLEWGSRSLAGGAAVSFLEPARGRKVMVYGTTAGEVLLEMRFQGALFASYRALVLPIKQIRYRANILNGPNVASQPRTSPQDVQNHIEVANRFLRQIGLQLVPDRDTTRRHGARSVAGFPGIFRIRVTANRTRNLGTFAAYRRATRLNARPNVAPPNGPILNIAYVHSARTASGPIRGAATDFPASGAGGSIFDTTTGAAPGGAVPAPTTSWYRAPGHGSGVPPDTAPDPAGTQMTLLPAHVRPGAPAVSNLFAFLMSDTTADPTTAAGMMLFGKTIAHELGHVLNLRHRHAVAAGGPDGLGHPARENVMAQSQAATVGQDFDIIQARAVQRSRLVPP